MTLLFTNNAQSTLASGISNSDTSIVVATGQGTLFPSPSGGDTFRATLVRASDGAIEIVDVTARSTDTLTVTRAQEGTTGLAFVTGDRIECRITAAFLNNQNVAVQTNAASSKTTPVDADELPLADSAAAYALKKLTWANLKATLGTWLAGMNISAAFTTLGVGTASPTGTFDVTARAYNPGTAAVSGTAVTGTNTEFTKTFKPGDSITLPTTSGSETKEIQTVVGDTSMTTVTAFAGTSTAAAYTSSNTGAHFVVLPSGGVKGMGTTGLSANNVADWIHKGDTVNITGTQLFATLRDRTTYNQTTSATGAINTFAAGPNINATGTGSFSNTRGFNSFPTVLSTNTGNCGNITAFLASPQILSGATGTITTISGLIFNGTNASTTNTVTNMFGVQIAPVQAGGTLTNYAGVSVAAKPTAATNSSLLLLGTNTIPSGNWAVYSSSTEASSLAGSLSVAAFTATGNAALGDAEATDTHAIKGATTVLANSASAALTVTQTGAGNAFVVEDSASTDSTPFVIDATGRVLIGGTASYTGVFNAAFLQAHNVAGNTAQSLQRYTADVFSADLEFLKSRNATTGSHTAVQSGDGIGSLRFAGSDGAAFKPAALIDVFVDGTPGTNDMPGRLVFSTTADGASSPTERMRIGSAGNVGIGGAAQAYTKLAVYGTLPSSSTSSRAVEVAATIPSTSTAQAFGYYTTLATQAAAFTLTDLSHYRAGQGTVGAGSAVTNQYGYNAESTLTGATNNFGFFGNIAAGANRFNFYAAGTAANYFAGSVGIGGAAPAGTNLYIAKPITGATTGYISYAIGSVLSDVTSLAVGYVTGIATQAAAFTLGNLQHFSANQNTIGATSAVTNQYGFSANSSLIGATNNYGFYSNIASAANRYNFYAAGTANNAYAGNSSFGKVTAPTSAVDTTSFGTNLVTNTAGTYTVLSTDGTIIQTTAASTYTLPTASSFPGRILKLVTQFAGTVVSASSNVVPIAGGAAGTAILAATAGKHAVLQSNGTDWVITEAN